MSWPGPLPRAGPRARPAAHGQARALAERDVALTVQRRPALLEAAVHHHVLAERLDARRRAVDDQFRVRLARLPARAHAPRPGLEVDRHAEARVADAHGHRAEHLGARRRHQRELDVNTACAACQRTVTSAPRATLVAPVDSNAHPCSGSARRCSAACAPPKRRHHVGRERLAAHLHRRQPHRRPLLGILVVAEQHQLRLERPARVGDGALLAHGLLAVDVVRDHAGAPVDHHRQAVPLAERDAAAARVGAAEGDGLALLLHDDLGLGVVVVVDVHLDDRRARPLAVVDAHVEQHGEAVDEAGPGRHEVGRHAHARPGRHAQRRRQPAGHGLLREVGRTRLDLQ
ncbi:MAG: hypothetical protein U1F43_25640 [Myxococcota bacterium]